MPDLFWEETIQDKPKLNEQHHQFEKERSNHSILIFM